jgi:hypothetical protein
MHLPLALAILSAATAPVPVDVWLPANPVGSVDMALTQSIVSSIYKDVGIQIHWKSGERVDGGSALAFEIRFIASAPESARPTALAAAKIEPGIITVYEDRVRGLHQSHPAVQRVVLAYVLAHELAHVMQGVARHSNAGILRDQWTVLDFSKMLFQRLKFTNADSEMIRRRLPLRLAAVKE